MKRKEAFQKTVSSLKPLYDPGEASSIARLVFSDLGIKSYSIYSEPEVIISSEDVKRLQKIMSGLLRGEPVQYVLGYSWFRGRKFYVDQNCLIPRQETEELVELILKENYENQNVIDIGTGSGCIAITLKSEKIDWHVEASELYTNTMEIARKNAKSNLTNVKFIQDDILLPDYNKFPEKYDLVVSNPPYVRESERRDMHRNVLENEPENALFVPDDNPLLYYRAIRQFCMERLRPGGKVYLEINESLGFLTLDIFKNHGFYDVSIVKDINNKDRFIKAKRNE